jgi:hypothetical protein
MATKRARVRARARAARWMATGTKRARATAARGMATATRVAGDKREGGDGGNGPWFVCVFWCVWRDHKK